MKHKFERYCKEYENIENYQKALADNFVGWCCHHRKGVYIAVEKLKALGMYYNRPASELIFLTESEHDILHKKGKSLSEEHKKKLSEAHKGKHLSEEHKNKIGEAHKGKKRSEETRKKIAEAKKNISEETRKKMSEAKKGNTATKGMRWFNNGKINKRCYECPPGFMSGMLNK